MKIVFFLLLIFLGLVGRAQHNMPGMPDSSMKGMSMKTTRTTKKSPARKNMRMNMSRHHKHVMSDTMKPGMKMNMRKNMSMGQMNDTMRHGMNMDHMNMMSHSYSRNLPMGRNGSGTSWMPDANPMYMYMKMENKSMFMIHGNIFLRYTKQDLFD